VTSATAEPPVSETTARAVALVAARRSTAEELGRHLAAQIGDPDELARIMRAGFEALADEEYRAGQQRVAPGIGRILGVRSPLLDAVTRSFRAATKGDRPSAFLYVADRLFREDYLEARWFAFAVLREALSREPERAWQLLRRGAREAGDWITVDSLAHVYARGILLEAYRWAELEQLIYSPSRWERRLVGSTIATLPFEDRREGRDPEVARRGLALIGELIGDAEPEVQKALSWALRSLVLVDAAAVTAFCRHEAQVAAASADGHRAWVVRDTLAKLQPATAGQIRETLAGVRKRADAPSTSRAGQTAADFSAIGLGARLPDPPLT
jgi:3-methyladenine DNA glycosylase AlkD